MNKLTLEQKKDIIDKARDTYKILIQRKLNEGNEWALLFQDKNPGENIYFQSCMTISNLIYYVVKTQFGLSGDENQIIDCIFEANEFRGEHSYNLVCGEVIDATIDQFNKRTSMNFSIYQDNSSYYKYPINRHLEESYLEIDLKQEIEIFNTL